MYINIAQAEKLVIAAIKAGLVPNLLSSPGVGKSDLIRQVAEKFNLAVVDYRLSQSDPTDLNGFPMLDAETKRADYAAPRNIPLITDDIPEGKDGWLLFFDEITSASNAVQASAYKIILDRMVGDQKIHPRVVMASAGNLITDRAIVNRLSTAMQSRLVHLQVQPCLDSWIKWAMVNNVDHRIISFLRFKPDLLHNFDPDHSDTTFACPRTWEFTHKILSNNQWDQIPAEGIALLAGTVGEGCAHEFLAFDSLYSKLPTKSDIVNNPTYTPIPDEPSSLYALTGAITSWINDSNIAVIMQYLTRLPIEFQIITLQNKISTDIVLQNNPEVLKWLHVNAVELV